MTGPGAEPDLLRGGGLPDPRLRFEFSHGWCTLNLSVPGVTLSLKATSMLDFFADLVVCLENVVAGSRNQSSIWGGEGAGWFIDVAANWNCEVAIVAHEMESTDYLRPGTGWLPIRGAAVGSLLTNRDGLLAALSDSLAQVRENYCENSGKISGWDWDFPEVAYQRIRKLR